MQGKLPTSLAVLQLGSEQGADRRACPIELTERLAKSPALTARPNPRPLVKAMASEWLHLPRLPGRRRIGNYTEINYKAKTAAPTL